MFAAGLKPRPSRTIFGEMFDHDFLEAFADAPRGLAGPISCPGEFTVPVPAGEPEISVMVSEFLLEFSAGAKISPISRCLRARIWSRSDGGFLELEFLGGFAHLRFQLRDSTCISFASLVIRPMRGIFDGHGHVIGFDDGAPASCPRT